MFTCGTAGKRFALPNSRIMIHQPWGGVEGQATDILIQANEIQRLKEQVDVLNGLGSPEVGSKSGLAANIAATDAVTTLANEVNVALTVTQETIATALDFQENVQSKQASILTKFEELTTLDQARKAQEIENIRIEFSNLLTAISLTFEANANLASELNAFLTPFRPDAGSILNLFT